jgi:hypothetical protein
MSRSAVVALVVGLVLVAALGVVGAIYKDSLVTASRLGVAIIFAAAVYGAALAAVSIRRIVDPKLPVPILAWIAVAVFWVMSILGKKDGDASSSTSTPTASTSSDDGMGRVWAMFSTLAALVLYGGAIAFVVYLAKHPAREAQAAKAVAEEPAVVAPRPVVRVPKDIVEAADLAAAIAIARPRLTDSRDAPSAGAIELTRYAAAKLRWQDVAVAKDETSTALVEKDPPAAIGKRLCASGTLARIEKADVGGAAIYAARLVTKDGDAIEIHAVGSTGALVKRKPARFCGVVVGRLDLTKPATLAIGMFDLPANRRP